MSNENTNNKRRGVYSNSDLNSYDGQLSALGFRLSNQIGAIDFSAINKEFIGKQPKKGDRVYNHDDKVSFYISGTNAVSFLYLVEMLRDSVANAEASIDEDGEVTEPSLSKVELPIGEDKSITLFAPGRRLKGVKADISENYILSVRTADDITCFHILQNTTALITDADKEEMEVTINTGLLALIEFLKQVIVLATGVPRQGGALAAPRGNGNSSSSSSRKAAFGAALQDDDDEFEDDDDEEDAKPSKPSKARPKALRGGKSKASVIEDEFDDE